MLIDDFTHQHFAIDIRMKSVNGKFGVHNLVGWVVEIWFKVNVIWLAAYPAVNLLEFCLPTPIGSRMEGELYIGGINGHQGQEHGADIVGLTFLPDGLQIVDDDFRLEIRGPQAVGARED